MLWGVHIKITDALSELVKLVLSRGDTRTHLKINGLTRDEFRERGAAAQDEA